MKVIGIFFLDASFFYFWSSCVAYFKNHCFTIKLANFESY